MGQRLADEETMSSMDLDTVESCVPCPGGGVTECGGHSPQFPEIGLLRLNAIGHNPVDSGFPFHRFIRAGHPYHGSGSGHFLADSATGRRNLGNDRESGTDFFHSRNNRFKRFDMPVAENAGLTKIRPALGENGHVSRYDHPRPTQGEAPVHFYSFRTEGTIRLRQPFRGSGSNNPVFEGPWFQEERFEQHPLFLRVFQFTIKIGQDCRRAWPSPRRRGTV